MKTLKTKTHKYLSKIKASGCKSSRIRIWINTIGQMS